MPAKIGDRGRATCPLYPSGRVLIDRAPLAARAEAGPIEEGSEIVVVGGGDRFSLIVRTFDPSYPINSLPRYGEPVLTAKEDAAFQASLVDENRRQERAEHQRIVRKMIYVAGIGGLIVGLCLMAIEMSHAGYSAEILWIPPLSTACWLCLVPAAFMMGAATESVLFFLSIPCAVLALVIGMVIWGPFVAIALCFVIGVGVNLGSFVIEAIRHPIH